MSYVRDDTIAALATAAGTGAIAIVRISGAGAASIAERLTGLSPKPRRAQLCCFTAADDRRIDDGLVLFFPAPRSYTGEDIVELHCHGGPVVSDWLLETIYAYGARAADPGEFTLRAFLNDKLDLTQAEAVADLIESRSRRGANAALRSLSGRFSGQIQALQTKLTELRVRIEAWLDFPDEELDLTAQGELVSLLKAIELEISALTDQARHGVALSDGLSIAIAGLPNAGKSSLLNRLAGYDAAIVTDIPGTTRDALRERLVLDGLPVNVVDTAGLRPVTDPVEHEGVRRAQQEFAKADHVAWVADICDGLDKALTDASDELQDQTYTIILNKVDLVAELPERFEQQGKTIIRLSALTGEGVDLLIDELKRLAGWSSEVAGTFSARRRHLGALNRAHECVLRAGKELSGGLELAAEELRAAQSALSEITGELTSDDLLGEIFSSFCIGK